MRFKNKYDSSRAIRLKEILKWQLRKIFSTHTKELSSVPLVSNAKALQTKEDFVCWLGHASFLVQIDQKRFLFDPVFGDIPFYKRYISTPYSIEVLGDIDYILISHVHYDHYDAPSLKALLAKNATFVVPLGMESYLYSLDKNIDIYTLDWYETHVIADTLTIDFVPSKHWGRRGVFDTNKALWGGYVITSLQKSLYFAGDTAYDRHFKEIGDKFNLDYALLPVGAYLPKEVMQTNHLNPDEAFTAYNDLQAKEMIPMHYGTFKLTDEPLNEPLEWVQRLMRKHPNTICNIAIGEVKIL